MATILSLPDTVSLNETQDAVIIIDQTKLPHCFCFLELKTQQQIFDAIRLLQVRGAPAIGVTAAFGMYLAAREIQAETFAQFYRELQAKKAFLAASRPTAVNLFWALEQMEQTALSCRDLPIEEIRQVLFEKALWLRDEDIRRCVAIGKAGLSLLADGWGILTHCNAGHLATVRYGTALAPKYLGKEQGYHFQVYADETRPLLQGARLTAFELSKAGIDVTLLCDNMAASLMAAGKIQAVLVGADRIARNGDTANKIGTSGIAVLAQYYHIPFYVCAPTSTIDSACANGCDIPIEERQKEEVTSQWYRNPMAPAGVKVYNPAFDVTKGELISAFVTEKGVLMPPFTASIAKVLALSAKD